MCNRHLLLAPSPLLQWHQFNYVDGGKGEPRMKREAEFSSLSLDHLGFAGSEDRNSPPFFSPPPYPACSLSPPFPFSSSSVTCRVSFSRPLFSGNGRQTYRRALEWRCPVVVNTFCAVAFPSPPLPPPPPACPATHRGSREGAAALPSPSDRRQEEKKKGEKMGGGYGVLFPSPLLPRTEGEGAGDRSSKEEKRR